MADKKTDSAAKADSGNAKPTPAPAPAPAPAPPPAPPPATKDPVQVQLTRGGCTAGGVSFDAGQIMDEAEADRLEIPASYRAEPKIPVVGVVLDRRVPQP